MLLVDRRDKQQFALTNAGLRFLSYAERLMTLKQVVVAGGGKAVTGVEMPVSPKRRFQDGAQAAPRARVTKAWCQRVFDQMWEERLRKVNEDANTRRSGNEMSVPVSAPFSR